MSSVGVLVLLLLVVVTGKLFNRVIDLLTIRR
jgi:hypothetical protein